MKLIDTHTHFYLPEFDDDRDEVIASSLRNGVVKLLMPNIDTGSVKPMMAAAERYRGICHPMIGLHPGSVKDDYLDRLKDLGSYSANPEIVAIGEVGIDLYWNKSYIAQQIDAFRKQVIISLQCDLPLVIHSREAFKEVYEVLSEFRGENLRGVFHAFSGSSDDARKVTDLGFYIGIGGVLTYKNSGLDKVVKETGAERIILETDSPWLAPVPHRGKRNESSYVAIINARLAELLNLEPSQTAELTYRNSINLFRL